MYIHQRRPLGTCLQMMGKVVIERKAVRIHPSDVFSLREGTIVRKKTSLFNCGSLKGIGRESLLSI